MSAASLFAQKEIRPSFNAVGLPSTDQTSTDQGCRGASSRVPESREPHLQRHVFALESSLLMTVALVASGALAGALEFFTHMSVRRMQVAPVYHALADAGMVTLMTIALVAVCMRTARARRRSMLEQMRTASDLNHHLRNALLVIAQSRYLPEEKQAQAVFSSLDRIDEALKRLSPN